MCADIDVMICWCADIDVLICADIDSNNMCWYRCADVCWYRCDDMLMCWHRCADIDSNSMPHVPGLHCMKLFCTPLRWTTLWTKNVQVRLVRPTGAGSKMRVANPTWTLSTKKCTSHLNIVWDPLHSQSPYLQLVMHCSSLAGHSLWWNANVCRFGSSHCLHLSLMSSTHKISVPRKRGEQWPRTRTLKGKSA